MKHYSDLDLIEFHYLGEAPADVRDHLASCERCAKALREVESSLQESVESTRIDVPETFWQRQKHSILHRVRRERLPWWRGRAAQASAAAMLLVMIGGGWLFVTRQPAAIEPAPAVVTQTASLTTTNAAATQPAGALGDFGVSSDPWASEQLEPLRDVVAWESWVGQNGGDSGGTL